MDRRPFYQRLAFVLQCALVLLTLAVIWGIVSRIRPQWLRFP